MTRKKPQTTSKMFNSPLIIASKKFTITLMVENVSGITILWRNFTLSFYLLACGRKNGKLWKWCLGRGFTLGEGQFSLRKITLIKISVTATTKIRAAIVFQFFSFSSFSGVL